MQSFRKIDVAWPADSRYLQTTTLNTTNGKIYVRNAHYLKHVPLTTELDEDITESNSAESPTNTEGRPVKDLNISEQIIQSPQIKESSYEEKPISPQVDEPDFSLSPTVVRTRSGRKVKSTKDNEKFVYF